MSLRPASICVLTCHESLLQQAFVGGGPLRHWPAAQPYKLDETPAERVNTWGEKTYQYLEVRCTFSCN